jgi:hypothetical protein
MTNLDALEHLYSLCNFATAFARRVSQDYEDQAGSKLPLDVFLDAFSIGCSEAGISEDSSRLMAGFLQREHLDFLSTTASVLPQKISEVEILEQKLLDEREAAKQREKVRTGLFNDLLDVKESIIQELSRKSEDALRDTKQQRRS